MAYCVFCEIVAGNEPASPVYADDQCTAFMDIRPLNAGHVLVVPNEHAKGLSDLSASAGCAMFRVAQQIAKALRKSCLNCEGVNLWFADGGAAGQEVAHAHLEVIPRYRGDVVGLQFGGSYYVIPDRDELDDTAQRIRGALHSV